MEHRHTRLKTFADLMEREYWIHAVPPKRCAQRSRTTWWEQGEASTTVPQQYQA